MKNVKEFYDSSPEREWERFDRHPLEWEITRRMVSKHIKPGTRVLDIGGGPGRYSMWLAKLGCDVTLVDLSSGNIEFAKQKAAELGLTINAICCDARELSKYVSGEFDHVLVMGPMYHLHDESDRINVIEMALSMLKSGGQLYVSFIELFSMAMYYLNTNPEAVFLDSERPYVEEFLPSNKSWAYDGESGFTAAYFIRTGEISEFMSKFPLKQEHLFAQEGILTPFIDKLLLQPEHVLAKWYDIAEALCERPELLGYAEHIMYIGTKEKNQ